MERNIQTQAIVIGSRKMGEVHKNITLFSKDLGIVNAILFGGRKGKNTAVASMFSCGTFLLYYNPIRDEYSIKEAVCDFSACTIESDLNLLYTASYFCELARATAGEEKTKVFSLLNQSLRLLEANPDKRRNVAIAFSWNMLQIAGVAPDLVSCPVCDKSYEETEILHFSNSLGVPCCESCADNHDLLLPPGARRFLRVSFGLSAGQILEIPLSEAAQSRILLYLLRWVQIFTGFALKTIQSGFVY